MDKGAWGLQSMRVQRVRHDYSNLTHTHMHVHIYMCVYVWMCNVFHYYLHLKSSIRIELCCSLSTAQWRNPHTDLLTSAKSHSLVAQWVKHLPTTQETWVHFLGREDPLEKEMAIYSSTLAWKMSWMEECGRLQSMGSKRVRHDWVTSISCQESASYCDFVRALHILHRIPLPSWLFSSVQSLSHVRLFASP